MSKPVQPQKDAEQQPVEFVRMNSDIYKQLEQQLPQPGVGEKTTDLQAGFQLGIQAVLKKLREGYVIKR